MGAELSGDGLSVMELSSKTQLVDDDQPSQWDWEVTGTSPGKRALHLHVWIRIQAPPLPEQIKDLPVLDREVEVQVNPSYQAMQFLLGNWQWLLGSGFSASFVAFIWKIRVTFESKRHARRCFLYRRCKS